LTFFNGYGLRLLMMIFSVIKNYLSFMLISDSSQLTEKPTTTCGIITVSSISLSSCILPRAHTWCSAISPSRTPHHPHTKQLMWSVQLLTYAVAARRSCPIELLELVLRWPLGRRRPLLLLELELGEDLCYYLCPGRHTTTTCT
jgi:hypothetical protein